MLSFLRNATVGLLVLLFGTQAQAAPTDVFYLDGEDRYSETAGVALCLKELGIPARSGVPGKVAAGKGNLLIVGSFVSGLKGKKAKSLLSGQSKAIAKFLAAGGTVLVLGQAAADDGGLTWLPPPLQARRGNRDARTAKFALPAHPLLSGKHQLQPDDLLTSHVLRKRGWTASSLVGATDIFYQAEGFEVLATEAGPDEMPLLMIGQAGPGAVILATSHHDKSCAYPLDKQDRQKARRFFENAMEYAGGRTAQPALSQRVDKKPLSRTVRVFEDLNENAQWEPGEPGMPSVEVLYGMQTYLTSSDGTAAIPIVPDDMLALSVAIPDGCSPTGQYYLEAASALSFDVGLRRNASGSDEAVIYHLSDVHMGDEDPQEDTKYLELFLRQLSGVAGRDDLFVMTGDITQRGYEDEFQGFKKAWQTLKNPKIVVMGNHDEGDGPETGRLFEDHVAPLYYTMEWKGNRLVTMPVLETGGAVGEWFGKILAASKLPIWVLTHKFPGRKAVESLDSKRVAAVLSGHWHGDMISVRNNILGINLGTSVFGAWDFTPAAARRIVIRQEQGGRLVRSQLVPFVRYPTAGVLRSADGMWHIGAALPFDSGAPSCSVGSTTLELRREGPHAWTASGPATGTVTCSADGKPIPMKCSGAAATDSCPGQTLSNLSLKWATQVPGRVVLGSPTVHGNHLLVPLRNSDRGDTQGGVCSVSVADGALEWCHDTPSQVASTPSVVSGVLLVNEVTGNRWGLDPGTGKVLWNRSLDEAISPAYMNHYLYAPGTEFEGKVYYCYQSAPFAVHPGSGAVTWRASNGFAGADHFGFSAGYVDGGYLYCVAYLGGLYRYDIRVNNSKREELNGRLVTCSDLVFQEDLLWVLTRGNLQGLKPGTWAADKNFNLGSFVLPVDPQFTGTGVLVPAGSDSLAMVNWETGKRSWTFKLTAGPMTFETNKHESAGLVGNPLIVGRRIYVPGTDGTLTVLENGTAVGSAYVGVPLASSPVARSGLVMVADYGGKVYAFQN